MEELVRQLPVIEDPEPDLAPPQPHAIGRVAKRVLAVVSLAATFGAASATAQSFNPEHDYQPEDCGSCVISADQAHALGNLAALPLLLEGASQRTGQNTTEQRPTKPHLAIGSEDDAVAASANPTLINTATTQARYTMGASVWRDIAYPSDYFGHRLGRYDQSISDATHKGMDVTVTLACNDEHWTERKFSRYVTAEVRHDDTLGVHEYSVCNEPNFKSWMDAMPGKTLPQTYCGLYETAYTDIKKQGEADGANNLVFSFEASSEARPLQFIQQVLNSCVIKTDAVAYHPYSQTSSPSQPCNLSGDIGFACLEQLEALVQAEYTAGRLETPSGQKPELDLSEFAYQIKIRSSSKHVTHSRSRYLPDSLRQQYYRRDLEIACDDPNIMRIGFYQLESPPLGSKKPQPWRSPLINPYGSPYGSLYVIQSFAKSHPGCVIG